MLGADILVAPVFSATGDVEFYLPAGTWTNLLTGEEVAGGAWRRERHGFTSLPLYVRPGAVIPWGARSDRPDYDYLDGLRLRVFAGRIGHARRSPSTTPDGRSETFTVDLAEVTGEPRGGRAGSVGRDAAASAGNRPIARRVAPGVRDGRTLSW